MARLRTVALPSNQFLIVIDKPADGDPTENLRNEGWLSDLKQNTGAKAVLYWPGELEIENW